MFASWIKSDLAAHDADEFFKLLREQTQCFTPLLQAALDEPAKPTRFCCRISTSSIALR